MQEENIKHRWTLNSQQNLNTLQEMMSCQGVSFWNPTNWLQQDTEDMGRQ